MTAGVTHYLQQTNPNYMYQPINRLDWLVEGLMLFSKSKQSEKTGYLNNKKSPKAMWLLCQHLKDLLF